MNVQPPSNLRLPSSNRALPLAQFDTENFYEPKRPPIRLHAPTKQIYHGRFMLYHLTPLQYAVLYFLITHPYVRLTKDQIIFGSWPSDHLQIHGVSDESLYQIIRQLRKKLGDDSRAYIVSWRGGYYFQPHGIPQTLPFDPMN